MKVQNVSRHTITIRQAEGRFMVDIKPGQTKDFAGVGPAALAILQRCVEKGLLARVDGPAPEPPAQGAPPGDEEGAPPDMDAEGTQGGPRQRRHRREGENGI